MKLGYNGGQTVHIEYVGLFRYGLRLPSQSIVHFLRITLDSTIKGVSYE